MKKILIAEDDKEIRELLKMRLKKAGYDVTVAVNGKEALISCKSFNPNLVLLDIAMPEMDGYQACEKLKENADTKDIAVLFLTGKDLDPAGMLKRCEELGACGYIANPHTFEELLGKIEEIMK
ncbi:MAG: hypothetical protein A2166_01120 [Omnitrophica WOR_2 bacterium RBG_13_41_10]|nr:MAG: hypothetical protein A2166_01120 [Omnitrophica WOR_2 bacterium RBG_13_41_10]